MDEMYAARDELVAGLERDLVGPRSHDEVLTDAPISTYVAGILFPRNAGNVGPENEVDEADDANETTHADPPVSLANARYPSSMGLTFAVDENEATSFRLTVKTARYEPLEEGEKGWRRLPLEFDLDVSIEPGEQRRELEPGLDLYLRIREPDTDGVAAVTAVLINTREAKPGRRDAASYFQVQMSATADGAPAFAERRSSEIPVDDQDLESYRLIYRDVHSYAVGHGTSVAWDEVPGEVAADRVSTATIPTSEVLVADSNPAIPADRLTMKFLWEGERAAVTAALDDLLSDYDEWIGRQRTRSAGLPEELRATAETHLTDCEKALHRMRSGVNTLRSKADAWRAFQLANRAMLAQRARGAWVADGRPDPGPQEDDSHRWRPFQIAFILLNVDGIVDSHHDDRELLDLLWFPTGGGKTEAYLGLIAFTTLLRRLRRGDGGRGVTVIMRYTLRLLTIQQFERAASLICALEFIRRQESDLGQSPISIALWVGRDGTPNNLTQARTALDKLRVGTPVLTANPVQVRACPWCGAAMTHKAYYIRRHDPALVITCPNKSCEFAKGLPIFVVDEDIYREQPTLVIATADKFATLPWVKDAHALFGGAGMPPPELIVQDELHLISGPLGTLAGLYEAVIDILCTENGIRPKVVASTATIRRASRQASALFDREMRQFPPAGIDAGDSFFSVVAPREEKASRLYVGALAPGTSQSTLMIRSFAVLMQGVQDLAAPDEVKDPYWTLVGYYNSLRVLGGARIQVLDDVKERIRLIAENRPARELEHSIELTSRESSADIPSHLERLAEELPDDETLDYVLATNMISAGVDVDRLGLMTVMGQPQATAEYIQATSRVGRRHPGLVLTLYNAGRSRDRSHYESFPTYHEALYRQVESTSVTPFSPRARDRGLPALLFSLARTAIPALRDNGSARDIESHKEEFAGFIKTISARAEKIAPGSGKAVETEFETAIDKWRARNEEAAALVYTNPRDADNSLLISADSAEGEGFPTPSSLRDVDSESNLYLVRV